MCACTNDTCWGGCPCGCNHTGPTYAAYYRNQHGVVFGPNPINGHGHWKRVLVIDPDSDDDLARLTDAIAEHCGVSLRDYEVRRALRSLLASPKPEEPTGLGAVVEDTEGERWVRTPLPGFDRPWTDAAGRHVPWSRIAAVRVLSEGVVA